MFNEMAETAVTSDDLKDDPSPDVVATDLTATTAPTAATNSAAVPASTSAVTSATDVTVTASAVASSSAQPETQSLKIHFMPGAVPIVPDLYYIPRNVYAGR